MQLWFRHPAVVTIRIVDGFLDSLQEFARQLAWKTRIASSCQARLLTPVHFALLL